MHRALGSDLFALAVRRLVPIGAVIAASLVPVTVHSQCWQVSPGHGAEGFPYPQEVTASALWNPGDGTTLAIGTIRNTGEHVEYWSKGQWITLGEAFNGDILSLATYNGSLYAGGSFWTIGGTLIPGLARWNGNAWVQVGSGISNSSAHVHTLVVYNNLLFVGGVFQPNDLGVQTFCDEWNGTSWMHGASPPGPIDAFGVVNGSLFCGTDSDSTNRGVYQYTGSQWIPLGRDDANNPCCFTSADVLAIADYQSHVVAGGEFERFVGPNSATWHVASWDGASWGPLASGLNSTVHVLVPYGTSLLAGGSFAIGSSEIGWDVAAWDGVSWSALGPGLHLGSGLPSYVNGLVPLDGSLVATGHFDLSGTIPIHGIARWDGARWNPWVAGINGPVRAFLPSGTSMIVAGDFDFTLPNNAIANHVMAVDTSGAINSYTDLQNTSGPNGRVNAVTYFQERKFPPLTALVVGGTFSGVGPTAAPYVAQFVNGTWGPIGAGFNAAVNALVPYGTALYAAGNFTASGATPVSHLAKFSAGAWSDLGIGAFPQLSALAVVNGLLLIGGDPGGNEGVTAWNGSSITMAAAANGKVLALAGFGRDIVAAGSFTSIAGVAAAGIARRDSVTGQWSAMGAGLSGGAVNALVVHNGLLYAGGTFTNSAGTPVQRFAVWSGTEWEDVANGVDDAVFALATWNGNLHLGGGFNLATEPVTISPYWIVQPPTCYVAVDAAPIAQGVTLASRPNPMIRRAAFQYAVPMSGHVRLTIDDVAGRLVRTLVNGWTAAGSYTVNWDGRSDAARTSPPGVYFAQLECDGLRRTCRLVLLP